MSKVEELLHKIKEIENLLKDVKLEVSELLTKEEGVKEENNNKNNQQNKDSFDEGEEVVILNPKPGQQKQGTVKRYNRLTGWVTIETTKGVI